MSAILPFPAKPLVRDITARIQARATYIYLALVHMYEANPHNGEPGSELRRAHEEARREIYRAEDALHSTYAVEFRELVETLRHFIRFHDQLAPADIARAKALIERVEK